MKKTWTENSSLSVAYTFKDEDIFYKNLLKMMSILYRLKNSYWRDVELVILKDDSGNNTELNSKIENVLNKARSNSEFIPIIFKEDKFEKHFAHWKNKLSELCTKDYILNLDADETMEYDFFIKLFNCEYPIGDNDVMYIPRLNMYKPNLTDEDKDIAKSWGWRFSNEFGVNDAVNFPDSQGRLYANEYNIAWVGKVHERIYRKDGLVKACTYIPRTSTDCIFHEKSFEKQIQQNSLYNSI